LKRLAFFKSRPQECYFCPLNNPCPKVPNCPHCGQMCLARGAADPPRGEGSENGNNSGNGNNGGNGANE